MFSILPIVKRRHCFNDETLVIKSSLYFPGGEGEWAKYSSVEKLEIGKENEIEITNGNE